jgi:hypothetical protein
VAETEAARRSRWIARTTAGSSGSATLAVLRGGAGGDRVEIAGHGEAEAAAALEALDGGLGVRPPDAVDRASGTGNLTLCRSRNKVNL